MRFQVSAFAVFRPRAYMKLNENRGHFWLKLMPGEHFRPAAGWHLTPETRHLFKETNQKKMTARIPPRRGTNIQLSIVNCQFRLPHRTHCRHNLLIPEMKHIDGLFGAAWCTQATAFARGRDVSGPVSFALDLFKLNGPERTNFHT